MRYVIAGLLVLFMLALAVGALTGRAKGRSACCPPSAGAPELGRRWRGRVEPDAPELTRGPASGSPSRPDAGCDSSHVRLSPAIGEGSKLRWPQDRSVHRGLGGWAYLAMCPIR